MVHAASEWDTERKGVTFFLSEKMNLENAESGGRTPLAFAATTKLYEVVKMLVSVCLLIKNLRTWKSFSSVSFSSSVVFFPLFVVDIALL